MGMSGQRAERDAVDKRMLFKLLTVDSGGMIAEDDADASYLVTRAKLLDWNDDEQTHTLTDKGRAVVAAAVEKARWAGL
jgi:hypothetical protein